MSRPVVEKISGAERAPSVGVWNNRGIDRDGVARLGDVRPMTGHGFSEIVE